MSNAPNEASGFHHQAQVAEGITVTHNPSPLGRRIIAFCIDSAALGVAIYAVVIVVAFVVGIVATSFSKLRLLNLSNFTGTSTAEIILILLALLVFLIVLMSVSHGYYIWFEYKKGGMTPGKRVMGLKVISLTGGSLTLGQCVRREVFRYIDQFLLLPGLISVLATDRKQRIGDLSANTMVVYSKAAGERDQYRFMEQAQYHYWCTLLKPGPIANKEADLFLGFAFPYLSGTKAATEGEIKFVIETIWRYLTPPGSSASPNSPVVEDQIKKLDNLTLIVFFAEYCFQSTKSK